jgi:predicted transposase YbfD/YdcC
MSKIVKPILLLRETITSLELDFETYKPPKRTIRRLIYFLNNVNDTRLSGLISYRLTDILVIAFLAVLAGAETWLEIASFAKAQSKWLRKIHLIEECVPSHDTFRRVFGLIDPMQFNDAAVAFLIERLTKIKQVLKIKKDGKRLICVDGKEAKGTGRKYGTAEKIPNLQTLNVFDASNGICLASIPIQEKTNEIPTAQAILSEMQLKESIVTFDAMNTQKDTIAVIVAQKGDYIGGLKGNHHLMHDEIKLYFSEKQLEKIRKIGTKFHSSIEKAHNRIEKRSYYLTNNINWFNDKPLWAKLRSFVCYICETEDLVTHNVTTEYRYYITSLTDVELCADAIRGHWSVENQLHWHLDVSFSEDDNTTADKNAFNNLSILNKLVLTLCKLIQPTTKKMSIKVIRKSFGWNFEEQLSNMLNLFDESYLENAMLSAKK